METQDNPNPADPAIEPDAAPAVEPDGEGQLPEAALSRDELARLVGSLADALAQLADDIANRRRNPVEVAAQLAVWARSAREQAGAQR